MSQPTNRYLTSESLVTFRLILVLLIVFAVLANVVLYSLLIWTALGLMPVVLFTWGCIMDLIDLMFYWSIQWLDFLGTFAL